MFTMEAILYYYEEFRNIFNSSQSITRNKNILLPKISKTISNKNSYIRAIKTYNILPKELKNLNYSRLTVKSKIKLWIKENI